MTGAQADDPRTAAPTGPTPACEQCGGRDHARSRPPRIRQRPTVAGAWLCDACYAAEGPRLADAGDPPTRHA